MKFWSVIKKSIKEQYRSFWLLILTVSMAPFFVVIYYLISEVTQPRYDLLVLNLDKGATVSGQQINHGEILIESSRSFIEQGDHIPLHLKSANNRESAVQRIKNGKSDALVVIPELFSENILQTGILEKKAVAELEFIGDLTNLNYMICAVWAGEAIQEYVYTITKVPRQVEIKETSLGISGNISDFDLYIPGLLILSVIMLMFSASIAVVIEAENKTLLRLNLSGISAFGFLAGVSVVQVAIGVVSVLLTLGVAIGLGFKYGEAIGSMLVLVILTSISIISFSLIVAALTKSANEVLVVGNFPIFLFMFFSGAAFPIDGKALFSVLGYPVSIQGLLSPTHGISAVKKVMIMGMGIGDVIPEILALVFLTAVYFIIGMWIFKRRHMKMQ